MHACDFELKLQESYGNESPQEDKSHLVLFAFIIAVLP